METPLGFRMRLHRGTKPTTLYNFPGQATGGEITRLAVCLATERGLRIVTSLHDSLVAECRIGEIELVQTELHRAMSDAARAVLGGFDIRIDSKVTKYPDAIDGGSGREIWATVQNILSARCDAGVTHVAAGVTLVCHERAPVPFL
jgi:hypothetical protein